MTQQPRVAIVGAGAMGCLFGAQLARTGVGVLLVDVDRRLVDLIRRDGVTVVRDESEQVTRVPATADPGEHEPVAAAIVLVKGYHTAAAAAFAQPLVGPDTVVASLQNGWGNEAILADELGEGRVLAGVTYHSATTRGPATVSHNAGGPTFLGPWGSAALDDCAVLARAFQDAGLDCVVTADVLTEVWKKLVFNAAGLAVGALTGLDPRGVAANREVAELVFALAREGRRDRQRRRVRAGCRRARCHPRRGVRARGSRDEGLHAAGRRGRTPHRGRHDQSSDRRGRRPSRPRRTAQPRDGRSREGSRGGAPASRVTSGSHATDEARDLHLDAIVIDGVDPSVPSRARFLRMRDAGVTAANVTLAIHENQTEAARAVAMWDRLVAENEDVVSRVETADDIRAAARQRRVGLIYGFQNGTPFEDELGFVAQFRRLGIRVVQPAYMTQNAIGCGCLEPVDSGLSAFGKDVVRELNAHGMTVDLSHCGPRTTTDAIEVSSRPVLFTHANSRRLVDNPRNKSDEELLALAEKGGVVGAVAFRSFLAPVTRDAVLADLLDHVDYLVELLGVDHVAIGTDFTEGRPEGFLDRAFGRNAPPGVTPPWPWVGPKGFETVDEFPNVTAGLLERGYAEADVRKILGENFLRVFAETWAA